MAPIALTDAQLDQVMTQAHQVPRALRDIYLQAVAELILAINGLHKFFCQGCSLSFWFAAFPEETVRFSTKAITRSALVRPRASQG
jgi:hypothetical protein